MASRPKRSRLTPERLSFLRTSIRRVQPWRWATGPRTPEGKARSSMNAFKHGIRSRESIAQRKEFAALLRMAGEEKSAI